MAKKGTKIKELAQRLGVTSRQLIDRCRDAGLEVQNSITKLSPELERVVCDWYAQDKNAPSPCPSLEEKGIC